MRGKLVVLIFLAGSVVFAAYAAWYLFNRSPIDQRFNMIRDRVPSAGSSALLPRSMDEFQRAGDVMSLESGGSIANYTDNDYSVTFTVQSLKSLDAALIADILVKPSCENSSGSVVLHDQSKDTVHYSYSTCQNRSTFRWINGDWLFTASGSDPEALLRFVNLFAF